MTKSDPEREIIRLLTTGLDWAKVGDYVMVEAIGYPPKVVATFRNVEARSVRMNVERAKEALREE